MVYNVPCKDSDHLHIDKTGRSWSNCLGERKQAFKSANLQSKLVNHAIFNSDFPDFKNITIIKSNCNNFKSRIFSED